MAKKYGSRSIPSDYAQGGGIFPIVPFKTQLQTLIAGVATNQGQEVELNLDFDYRQVFDIMMIKSTILIDPPTTLVDGSVEVSVALTDDPNKATATDISTDVTANTGEATFENDQSFFYTHDYTCGMIVGESALNPCTDRQIFVFEQPWIVARNIKWIQQTDLSTAASFVSVTSRLEIWGRRRRASEKEFYSIVQRQRF